MNDSPGTKVLHNTVIFEDDYANAIEYRFAASRGLTIANNLTNKSVRQRDGAQADVRGNVTQARPEWFARSGAGDLHLTNAARAVIDRVTVEKDCPEDIDGQKRPIGKAADVGADEAGK